MWTFHLGPPSPRARVFLGLIAGCAGMGVLIGPTLFALADSPPIAAATSWTPLRVVAVKAFQDLGADGCILDRPVHAGPVAVQGTVAERSDLEARFTSAVFACASDDWTGDVTISAAVDARGAISDVHTAGNASPLMQRCLAARVADREPIGTRGPGTLRAGYFMGHR